jgi:RNase P/RNase MRP subunit POP5
MPEKKLKPSLREKKRYLYLETKLSKEEIEKVILDYIGILGYSKSGVYFIKKNILAVNRDMINEIKAAFSFVDIKVKKVSGSLKKVKGED